MATAERPTTSTVVRVTLTIAAVLFLLYTLYLVRNVLILVIVALFLAVGLDPAARKLEGLGLRRGHAIAAIFLSMLAFIAAFIWAVVPPLVSQVTDFATNLPDYIENIAEQNPRVQEWIDDNEISQKLREATENVPSLISGSLGGILGFAGSVASTLFNTITILVLSIYFLMSLSEIRHGTMRLVPKSKRERTSRLLDPILEKIGGYIAGQITVALIAGVLAFIFLRIVGVPSPIALSLWVAIAALIPMVGATLGAIPAVIVAFFDSTGLGVATLVWFIIYQQVENYVIAPRIMTKAVDISPAAVLLAALIGGSLLGFFGALMAIPTAAAIKLIFQEVVQPKAEAS
jgi:predicted PurR-regulated permease PerM